jgi:hypothetical protein
VRCVRLQVKAGDASAAPEALRQYTEGLTLLQEAIDSGNYNEKVCESLNKKAKGVRKRIKDLGGKVPSGSSPKKPAAPKAVNFKEDAASPPSKAGGVLTEDEMAAEVKQWTGQTAKALKASPVHGGIELTGARLTVCTKGDVYTIAEAGHHKGKLALCVVYSLPSICARSCRAACLTVTVVVCVRAVGWKSPLGGLRPKPNLALWFSSWRRACHQRRRRRPNQSHNRHQHQHQHRYRRRHSR